MNKNQRGLLQEVLPHYEQKMQDAIVYDLISKRMMTYANDADLVLPFLMRVASGGYCDETHQIVSDLDLLPAKVAEFRQMAEKNYEKSQGRTLFLPFIGGPRKFDVLGVTDETYEPDINDDDGGNDYVDRPINSRLDAITRLDALAQGDYSLRAELHLYLDDEAQAYACLKEGIAKLEPTSTPGLAQLVMKLGTPLERRTVFEAVIKEHYISGDFSTFADLAIQVPDEKALPYSLTALLLNQELTPRVSDFLERKGY